MGCLKSKHQGDIAQPNVRFKDLNDGTIQKGINDVMIEAEQENRDNIQTFNEIFKRTLCVIGERGYDKQLIYDLLESNTKLVSIYIDEKYKLKLINKNSDIDRLKKSIEPLQHQLKTCLFVLDKGDFITKTEDDTNNLEASEGFDTDAKEEGSNDDDFRSERFDDETDVKTLYIDENQLDPQYKNGKIMGEEMDRLVQEKNKIEAEKDKLEMQLKELNANFNETRLSNIMMRTL